MASEEKCFTFEWKLEHINFCALKKRTKIISPAFVVDSIDETKWYLGLYLRNGNFIPFYLYRDADSKGAVHVEIYYELAFIAEDGSVLKSYEKSKFNFPKNYGSGFPEFVKWNDLFISKRSAFLPRDTLTARCRIWKSVGQMAEGVRCFARTHIGIQKRTFLWNVKNFSTLESENNCSYEIKSIETDASLLSVDLSLTGGFSSEEIIRFELSLQDKTKTFFTLRLSLVNASGNRVQCNQEEFWFDDVTKSKEFKFFFTKSKLIEMKSLYLPDDILSLHWEWAFSKGVISNEIEDVQYACASSDCNSSHDQNLVNQKMIPLSYSLNDNLKSLYEENFLCDVKVKTSTSIFPAHKIILSASSSVFKAMFSSDMKEKDSNCINIEDLSDDTISRMLVYIYTSRMEDLTWENASDLYVASDKYTILSLKNICSSYLKNNLSPSNACEVLLLSDFHADGDLKSAVQDYILKYIKDIVNSDEWKLLIEANAKLAAETVCLQYK